MLVKQKGMNLAQLGTLNKHKPLKQTHNTPNKHQYYHYDDFNSFPLTTNSLCMVLHMSAHTARAAYFPLHYALTTTLTKPAGISTLYTYIYIGQTDSIQLIVHALHIKCQYIYLLASEKGAWFPNNSIPLRLILKTNLPPAKWQLQKSIYKRLWRGKESRICMLFLSD